MSTSVFLDAEILQCPHCSGDNLHHGDVSVFTRAEDDEMVMATHVMGSPQVTMTSRIKNADSQNPSSRRHGMVIEFECETCDNRPKLAIIQHKGSTIMEWK
jgi:hypothetical protein